MPSQSSLTHETFGENLAVLPIRLNKAVLPVLLLVVPSVCSMLHIPVKRFTSPVYLTHKTSDRDSGNQGLQVYQRDVGVLRNNMTGLSGDGYYIDVFIGTPPQKTQILIDTGSSNFAVASDPYPDQTQSDITRYFSRENSTSYYDDGREIEVAYTEGEWHGILGTDIVSLSLNTSVSARINIACIIESHNFFTENARWQGILGLAYAELSRPSASLEPFWDSMISQNKNLSDVFSLLLCGSSFAHTELEPLKQGTLVLGGVDPSLSKTPLVYTPIYKKWYYEVIITRMEVGGVSLAMPCKEYNFDKTIVDSGTTNIHLPYAVFNNVVNLIHSQLQNSGLDVFDLPVDSFYVGDQVICFADAGKMFRSFPVVSFYLQKSTNSSFKLEISPQNYLRPVEGLGAKTCVKFGFSKSTTGTVLGAVLMEAFYVVFDRNSSQIGFGVTSCPLPDPAHPRSESSISGPFYTPGDLSVCAYKKPESPESLMVVSYVMAGLAVVVVMPLCLLMLLWGKKCLFGTTSPYDDDDSNEMLADGR